MTHKALLLLCLGLILGSCGKDAFEKLRLSNDIELKYTKAFEYYEAEEYQKAQYLLEDLIGAVRLTERAEKVYFYYAYTHYHLSNYTFSSYYFKQFSNTFPNGARAEEALFMSAESFYELSPTYRLTQEDTYKAIEGYQLFANSYPNSERISICNKKIDELRAKLEQKALESAKGYYRRRHYQAANHSFNSLLVDFPDTQNKEFIRYMLVKSAYKYAMASVLSKQVERFESAVKHFEMFKKRHTESEYFKEAESIRNTAIQKIKKLQNE